MKIEPPAGKEWRVFTCTTCYLPDDDDPSVTNEDAYRYIAPIRVGADPDACGPLDFCPDCGSYLSMVADYGSPAKVEQ